MASAEKQEEMNSTRGEKTFNRKIVALIAIVLALFHLYTAYFGALGAMRQRSIHIFLVLIMIFLLYPTRQGKNVFGVALDALLAVSSLAVGLYLYFNADQFAVVAVHLQTIDVVVGLVGILLVLEGTRRVMGWIMPLLASIFLAYAFLGPYMPLIVAHRGFGLERVAYQMFFTMEGVLGSPLGVSATFVAVFVIFAAFLRNSGAGDFLINIAFALFGRYRGGPAKVAVISSSLFGTVSGSAVANVVGTGTFTIPLMKSVGYNSYFAGAIEAVSSTGGQIMPPIMGAAAFLMTEFIGVPYTRILLAAIIPALLYYFTLFAMVDFEAERKGLNGLPKEELPSFKKEMRQGWPFLIPVVVLLYFLTIDGSSPSKAAFWAVIATLIVGMLHPGAKLKAGNIIACLEEGGKGLIEVAVACGTAGIIIGVITLTGLGLKLSMLLVSLSGGSTIVLLILTAVASLILGMGVPTTAAYLLVATLVAPALIKMGVFPLAAHLFVFYFSVVSMITPPVALAAYAAAGIAQANPMKTGFTALRLGITALIIPFMFTYGPELLLEGTWTGIALSILTSTVGVFVMSIAIFGWFKKNLGIFTRIILFAGALSLIKPGLSTDMVGLVLIVLGFILIKKMNFPKSIEIKEPID